MDIPIPQLDRVFSDKVSKYRYKYLNLEQSFRIVSKMKKKTKFLYFYFTLMNKINPNYCYNAKTHDTHLPKSVSNLNVSKCKQHLSTVGLKYNLT